MHSSTGISPTQENDTHEYKLYKRRFLGLFGMVCYPGGVVLRPCQWHADFRLNSLPLWLEFTIQSILNLIGGMALPWFGPIAGPSASTGAGRSAETTLKFFQPRKYST